MADPIIEDIRTLYEVGGYTYRHISAASGVSTSTLVKWFDGTTKHPRPASVSAVLRVMGYEVIPTPTIDSWKKDN